MTNQPLIIGIALILGIASGAVMHRADFCIAGMFRDLFLFRNSPLLRSLVLLVAGNTLLFEIARLTGLINYQLPSSLFGLPAITTLLGGILFGTGMVLAGGCVIGTLYKLGAGSLPASCAFVGLLAGSALYAEFHPQWKQLATATRLSDAATLPQLLNLPQPLVTTFILAGFALLLWRWQKNQKLLRPNILKNYLQPRSAALLLALISLLSFTLTGMPLGITTSYAKGGAFIEQLILPDHVSALSYFQARGFHYFSPLAGETLSAGAGPFWDGLSLVQFPLIGGVLIGSAFSAAQMGKFQFRIQVPKIQLFSALCGGIMMGLASRMTPACNVWHILGGLPLLSLESLLFTVGLFPGAWLGTLLLTRLVLTQR